LAPVTWYAENKGFFTDSAVQIVLAQLRTHLFSPNPILPLSRLRQASKAIELRKARPRANAKAQVGELAALVE
jgi:hypothetical protein